MVGKPTSTMNAGDQQFFSPAVLDESLKPTTIAQDDLNQLHKGAKIAFIVTEIFYKDQGRNHHLKRCMWLQPPAYPPGIWHFCGLFNDSD